MAESEGEAVSLDDQCAAVVEQLLEHHEWQLVARDELVRQTCLAIQRGRANDARSAAVHTYCLALYRACSGVEGGERQNRGYTELYRYVQAVARTWYGELAAEVAQNALERVFDTFDRCQGAETFLAFALQCLRNVVKTLRREEDRRPESLDAISHTSEESLIERLEDPRQPDPGSWVLRREFQSRCRALLNEFRRLHPRSDRQLDALLLKHLEGLTEDEICDRLNMSPTQAQQARARAKAKLMRHARLRALAADVGILPDVA